MPINRHTKNLDSIYILATIVKLMMQKTKKNKLYKIQPVIDHVRNTCCTIKPEIENSIDEQIIPAKTKYSGIR